MSEARRDGVRQAVVTVADRDVPIRCPDCRREHLYAPSPTPCSCGAQVAPPVARGAPPVLITDQTWTDQWVTLRCWSCGHQGQWPHPELDCPCGAVLRIPVAGAAEPPGDLESPCGAEPSSSPEPSGGREPSSGPDAPPVAPSHIPLPRTAPRPRPAFRPVTIRDARDAVTVAALYLRWLGYLNTRSAAGRPPSGTRIAARGLLAQVEPALRPTTLRDIECLWLTAMTEAGDTPVTCAFFSLSGYTAEARACADTLDMPLFTMDLTGTPQPVNSAADELVATGA